MSPAIKVRAAAVLEELADKCDPVGKTVNNPDYRKSRQDKSVKTLRVTTSIANLNTTC